MSFPIVLLVGCLLTVVVLVIGYGMRMVRIRVARWQLWAEQNELYYFEFRRMGLGVIKGEVNGRDIRLKAINRSAGRGIQRSSQKRKHWY